MSDLVTFLRARLDEDEAVARDPARVLREVEAGRAILAEHERYTTAQMRHVLFLLAAVYRDHPDYDEAWKP